MYYAKDNYHGDVLNGKNIVSYPGHYVGRVDYVNAKGEYIVGRYFYKEDVFLDPGRNNDGFEYSKTRNLAEKPNFFFIR